MTRIIVESIDSMPGEARDGLPLGCVLETEGPRVVAFGPGSSFSKAGLRIIDAPLTFVAHFGDDCEVPVEVRAKDIQAATKWLRRHFCGSFSLYVEAANSYLGEFTGSEESQS